ncbi:MAG TPA: hypothetical protein VE111_05300 [Bradyrhizobium sp.]|nr:hypothetical protein [Bradyrhizobium sp.]
MSSTPDELMGIFRQATLPIGGVVAIARLDAAFQLGNRAHGTALPAATVVKRLTSRPMPECFTVRYDDFGDYAPGRGPGCCATSSRSIHRLMKGRQGFFDLPQEWLAPA